MSTGGDHEFKDPVLRAEFDILPPAEGSGRKIDIAHCRNCHQWHQALHAPRMKKHLQNCESYKRRQAEEGSGPGSASNVVSASQTTDIDDYWEQLGFGVSDLGTLAATGSNEDTRPDATPRQKDALAMSAALAVIMGARPLRMLLEEDFRYFLTALSGFR
jgi:predicted anti-sigma-YlaC factor YlaD